MQLDPLSLANETLMGCVAAGHCQWSHGQDMGAHGYCCCSSEVSEFPAKRIYASRSSCQVPSRAETRNHGGGNPKGLLFRAQGFPMAGLSLVSVEWRSGQGRGCSACSGSKAGCVSPLQGEGSEITQASWILNPRCLFGRGSEGFSILQGLQMGVGLLPSNRMGLCRMAPL